MASTLFKQLKLKKVNHFKILFCNTLAKEIGRRCSSKYFLTIPIFYVNAEPHIGHLYTAVIGDAANRFQKLKNPALKTKFMVGTDEHGLKVSQAANYKKVDVKDFCCQVSNKYKHLFELCNIDYDDFVRTTEDRHFRAVEALWNKLYSKKLIYRDNYSGWYCIADEMFVSEQNLAPKTENNDIRYTLEGNKPVHYMEEENYRFKLSAFQDDLLHWLKDEVVKPKMFQSELVHMIEEGTVLQDLSLSRPSNRVPWGIPVPGDPSQTIYVWLDALSSYLCANGYPESSFKWPPDTQILGKDILRFHGVFWPAFLMAADLEPPKRLLVHSHWLKDDQKMSKSLGNVVDPFDSCSKYTSDGLRYFLLRGGVPHSDGNFSEAKVIVYLNAELADCLGNLLSRCTGKSINRSQVFPALFEDYRKYFDESCDDLVQTVEGLQEKVTTHFEDFNFYKGIDEIMEVLRCANRFFQVREPWKPLGGDPDHAKLTLHLTMEALRVCGILLQPITPNISKMLLDKLSIPVSKRSLIDIQPYSWQNLEAKNVNLMTGSVKLFSRIVS